MMIPLDARPEYTALHLGAWPEDLPRDGALGALATALQGVVESWQRIRSHYRETMLDLTMMPLARLKAVERFASTTLETATRRVDAAVVAAREELEVIERKHAVKPGDMAATLVEGEVRAYLRGLDEPARLAALHEAARTGDVLTLRAAILAPRLLLPLTDEQLALLRHGHALATDPHGVERAAAITNGMERVVRAGTVLLAQVTNLIPSAAAKASSSDRTAASLAEQLAEREQQVALAEVNIAGRGTEVGVPTIAV